MYRCYISGCRWLSTSRWLLYVANYRCSVATKCSSVCCSTASQSTISYCCRRWGRWKTSVIYLVWNHKSYIQREILSRIFPMKTNRNKLEISFRDINTQKLDHIGRRKMTICTLVSLYDLTKCTVVVQYDYKNKFFLLVYH